MNDNEYLDKSIINSKPLADYISEGKVMTPIGVHHEGSEIMALKLDDGRIIDRTVAFRLCNEGLLENCTTAISKTGDCFVRSMNDGDPSNNLGNLPEF